MGGSGIYSMVLVIAPRLVPGEKHGKYMAVVASVFAIASILGPIFGGAITTHSTWRRVFLLEYVIETQKAGLYFRSKHLLKRYQCPSWCNGDSSHNGFASFIWRP